MPYRRSILLINKRFQLRFCVYVCVWLVALCFIYPFIVQNIFDYFIRYVAQDPMGPPIAGLQATRREVLSLLVLIQLVFLGITFLVSLFLSHRIAGPLYKLSMSFQKVRMGSLHEEIRFRSKDHFMDLAESYNEMLRGLRSILGKQSLNLNAVIQELESLKNQGSFENHRDSVRIEKSIAQLKEIRDKLPQ